MNLGCAQGLIAWCFAYGVAVGQPRLDISFCVSGVRHVVVIMVNK